MEWTQVARNEFPTLDRNRIGQIDVAYVFVNERNERVLIMLALASDSPERLQEELDRRAELLATGARRRFTTI